MTRLLRRLKRANIITMSPAVLKNTPEYELFWMLKEEKLMSPKTGSVPSANAPIVKAPLKKLPVERV